MKEIRENMQLCCFAKWHRQSVT